MKKTFRNIILCLLSFCSYSSNTQAQLPTCANIYYDDYDATLISIFGIVIPIVGNPTGKLYSYDPTVAVSPANPSLNTISLPPGYVGGLTLCEVLNSGNATQTFYCVTGTTTANIRYNYYDPVSNSWVNTGHNPAAVNIAAGGNGNIYSLDGATGRVYKYDGTSNATLLIQVPGFMNEGPYDLIADCEGDWYILNFTGMNTPPFLRKYSAAGVLLESWTVTNPNNYEMRYGGGFAIVNNTIYADAIIPGTNDIGMAYATLTPGNITFNNITAAFPSGTAVPGGGGIFTQNIFADLGSCAGAIPTIASIAITANPDALCAGTSVTYTSTITGGGNNPRYQWFINGAPVPGATAATFTHNTGLDEEITCQLTSSSLCVPEKIVMSAPAVIDVVDGSTPVLSYEIDKICTGEAIQIEPITFTPKKGTFSVSPSTGLNVNTTTGAIDFRGAAVGDYTISYTTKGNRNCPSKTATVSMKVLATPFVEIKQMNEVKSLCEGSEIRLATTLYPNATYHWWPQRHFEDNFFENEVSGKFPEGTSTVSVYVEDENGCVSRDTTTVRLEPCCKFDIPNAFSPNGDGRNDYFGPISLADLAIIDFSIYNRWGELVYKGAGPNVSWDGKLKGKALAQGVYTYNLEFRCDGVQYNRKGDVALIR